MITAPCKHVKSGESKAENGICWACGASNRADVELTGLAEAMDIAERKRHQRKASKGS